MPWFLINWALKNWKVVLGGLAVIAVLLLLLHVKRTIYNEAVEDIRVENLEKVLEQEQEENEIEKANAAKSDATILNELLRDDLREEI